MVGQRGSRHVETPFSLEQALADLEYYEIHGALVYSAAAKEYFPARRNAELDAMIEQINHLCSCWVVLPSHAGEMPDGEELVKQMKARGARAARIFPKSHGFGTSELVCGDLFAALEQAAVPLFVDRSETELEKIASLCGAHPNLPVVLCGVAWSEDRALVPLLKAHQNLHLETAAFQGHRAFERVVREVGAERLLFGTDWPLRSPGAAKMMVLYENISDEDREKIAHGNLERLIGPVETQEYPETERDPIVAALRAGEPLSGEFVFDAHAHLADDGCMGVGQCALAYNDAAGLIGTMDRLGIDKCLASSWGGILLGDRAGNDVMLAAAERYPGRIIPYGTLNPNYPELFEEEFERVFASGRVKGFKPYPPRQQYPLDGERNKPLLQWAQERGAPVLCHCGLGGNAITPGQVDKLAEQYPGANFLFAHVGQSYAVAEKCVEVCKQHSNVYCEITYTAITYGLIEYLVREVGAEKVLFGTDCVMRDAAPQLGWVGWARISLEDKRKILGGNMGRLLGLSPEEMAPRGPGT